MNQQNTRHFRWLRKQCNQRDASRWPGSQSVLTCSPCERTVTYY